MRWQGAGRQYIVGNAKSGQRGCAWSGTRQLGLWRAGSPSRPFTGVSRPGAANRLGLRPGGRVMMAVTPPSARAVYLTSAGPIIGLNPDWSGFQHCPASPARYVNTPLCLASSRRAHASSVIIAGDDGSSQRKKLTRGQYLGHRSGGRARKNAASRHVKRPERKHEASQRRDHCRPKRGCWSSAPLTGRRLLQWLVNRAGR
jgi:hypothetical protein